MDPSKLQEIILAGLFIILGSVITLYATPLLADPGFDGVILLLIAIILILAIILVIKWNRKFTLQELIKNKLMLSLIILILLTILVILYLLIPYISEPQPQYIPMAPFNGTIDAKNLGSYEINSTIIWQISGLIRERIEPDNYLVRKTAIRASRQPGLNTMYQICSIYNFLKFGDESTKGWFLVSKSRSGSWHFANESLRMGDDLGFSGTGDAIDFAIVASSLIESIGGTTRIIFAYNQSTSSIPDHVYSEVYIGHMEDNSIKIILDQLKKSYDIKEIYFHLDNGDLWLNFDFLSDHPGGPFFQSQKHTLLDV
jgi:hypothetical protein